MGLWLARYTIWKGLWTMAFLNWVGPHHSVSSLMTFHISCEMTSYLETEPEWQEIVSILLLYMTIYPSSIFPESKWAWCWVKPAVSCDFECNIIPPGWTECIVNRSVGTKNNKQDKKNVAYCIVSRAKENKHSREREYGKSQWGIKLLEGKQQKPH